jgi:hypothetical protein
VRSRPKPFLDDARRDWQFDAYAWLLRQSGGYQKFLDTTLVLPTLEYFPDRGLKGHAAVAALFHRVRDHAGMADWPCAVQPEDDTPTAEDPERIPVFRYRRDSLEAVALVANFAREFARYLVATFDAPAPGPESRHEAAVELAAVFMGFGIFLCNAGVRDTSYQLSEGELAHALAIFCLLRREPEDSAGEHLNPHLRKHLRLAMRDLAGHETRFQKLRASDTAPPAVQRGAN